MDFKKKLKIRLYVAISYIIFGILLITAAWLADYEILSSLGIAFVVMGLARIRQYRFITRDEEALHRREIAETDERNLKIYNQARSLAFLVYVNLCGFGIIALFILNLRSYAELLSYNLIAIVAIYWVCYYIMRKKY